MATFLERLIPQLAKAVVTEEVPAREHRPAAPCTPTPRARSSKRTTSARAASPGRTTRGASTRTTSSSRARS